MYDGLFLDGVDFDTPEDYPFLPEVAMKDLIYQGIVAEQQRNDEIRRVNGGYDEEVKDGSVKLARLSQSGGCPLQMYLDITGAPKPEIHPLNFQNIRSQLTFQYGHMMEDMLVDLIHMGVEAEIQHRMQSVTDDMEERHFKTKFKKTISDVYDSQRVVKLQLDSGYVTGRLDGIIRMNDTLYLTEFKTSNMDYKPWNRIFKDMTAEELADYCLNNQPRTNNKDEFYIFKYLCQVNAYLEALDSEKDQEKLDSGLLIVKNKKLASIQTMHVPRIPEVKEYYRNIWQDLIYALIKKEEPKKPDKYKIKSAPPCQYCAYKDKCWAKPEEIDVFDSANLLV